jgi:hypothetical protein
MNPLVLLIAGLLSATQDRPVIPLPADPSTVIISLDRRGGFTFPRKDSDPILTIRADGRVKVIDPWGIDSDKETILSPAEVQELLYFAVTQQDFFAFSAATVRQDIQAEFAKTGRETVVSDESDTVVRIRTASRDQEARYNGLSYWANRFSDIKMLQQLRAIETKLTQLEALLRAGGNTEVAEALDRANVYLKEKYPTMPPLVMNDYQRTLQSVLGDRILEFSRSIPGDRSSVSVTVRYPRSGPPQVTSD